MFSKWIKLRYKDAWYPEGNTCVLTDAKANGRWTGELYAIFGLDEQPHVAFWPIKPIVLGAEELLKEEASAILRNTINGTYLEIDFKEKYGT